MTKVNIDLWVLLAGVALPSACLLLISLTYCWRRLTGRRNKAGAAQNADPSGFNQQMLLELVLQHTDNAFNSIIDTVHQQRLELLKVLETHQLEKHLSPAECSAAGVPAPPLPTAASLLNEGAASRVSAEDEAFSPAGTSSPGSDIRTKESAALFDPYSQIPEYIQKGLSVKAVAARLNLPEAAVELYVKLRLSAPDGGRQKTA